MKFTFKPFRGDKKASQAEDSASPPTNPQAKRRDQIRRAQKTHRERKEAYTKSLELEVIQLRANEAKIMQETKMLYAEITNLKSMLMRHGIEVPVSNISSAEEQTIVTDAPEFELYIPKTTTKGQHQRIHVQPKTARDRRRQQQPTGPREDSGELIDVSLSNFSLPFSKTAQSSIVEEPANTVYHASKLDPTAVGMDFVLTLESPCLAHNIPHNEDTATGHALTASATLLHHHPKSLENCLHSSHQATWQVSSISLERLLQLSENIPLSEGELTPVQAWDKVRQHPDFAALELTRLEALKQTLLASVTCYGFGGVIDQGTFEDALFETFVVGRVF